MTKLRAALFLLASFVSIVHAGESLLLPEARQRNPEFFQPGLVSPSSINGKDGYVVCVYARKDFASESAQEIINYLTLRAKKDLIDFLEQNKNHKHEYSINSFDELYQWQDGDLVYANFFIPTAGIQKLVKNDVLQIESQKSSHISVAIHNENDKVAPLPNLDLNEALKHLEDEFMGRSSLDSETHLKIISLSKSNFNELLKDYLTLKQMPNSIDSLKSIALYNENDNKPDVALNAYMRLRGFSPTLIEEHEYKIASLYEQINDLPNALKEYSKFNDNFRTSRLSPVVLRKINLLKQKK